MSSPSFKVTAPKKRVLLTGVAGFIGAHTLEHFLENTDWHIIGLDSLEHHGNIRRVWQVLGKNEAWRSRFEFIKYDLTHALPDPAGALCRDLKLCPAKTRIDYMISMAAESHVDRSIAAPVAFIKNNVDLTLTMLEWARVLKPKAFIQISTDEVYGPMINARPFEEWERELPSNPYSASKAAQEMLAISYWRTFGVPLVITNTMNNIGEMQDAEKFVPKIIKEIYTGKSVEVHGTETEIGTRFYLHARNHADALLFILSNLPPVLYSAANEYPSRYNVVGDVQLSNLEMAQKVARLMKRELKYYLADFHSTRPGHDLHYGLDGTLLKKAGWKPPLSFDESLARTVANYLEHKEWLE